MLLYDERLSLTTHGGRTLLLVGVSVSGQDVGDTLASFLTPLLTRRQFLTGHVVVGPTLTCVGEAGQVHFFPTVVALSHRRLHVAVGVLHQPTLGEGQLLPPARTQDRLV